MNKVFKVIWSEARNAYVVVSEFAKNHGSKSCSTKKLLAMLIATGIMTCASVAPAMAANLAPKDTKIEIGADASASGEGSVAIGNNAQASGLVGIAIGRDAVASGTDSIAIGSSTKANQTYSVAVGNDIQYIGQSATAVGQQAYATGDNSTAIGTMTNVDADWNVAHQGQWRQAGNQSTAIGAYAGSWGDYSTSVGTFSKTEGYMATAVGYASKANSKYGTALGDFAEAKADWGVALGASSVADRGAGMIGAFAPEGADSLTWRANGGAVSVGSATLTRQITNVAAGTEATDAVNVAQLQEATQNTGWHLSAEKEITKDINSTTKIQHGDIVHFQGTDDNITISKEETEDATVMHVALSRNLAIDSVQAGDFFMNNEKGIGFGGEAYITQNGLNANDKVITNVAAGTADTDAVNVGQLKNSAWKLAANGVLTEAEDVKAGDYVDFNGDQNVNVSKDAKDGVKTVKVELNKDLVGIESISNGDAKMALNGAAGTAGMINGKGASIYMQDGYTVINSKVAFDQNGKISGVAAGVADTDAVNVGQLKNSAWKLAANGVLTEAEDVKAGDYVDFNGDQNVNVSKDAKDGVKTVKVELNKDLVGIESISNGDAKMALNGAAGTAGMINGKGASIYMQDGYTVINSKVAFDQNGKISGVAAGVADTDAVNVGQLKAVGATANMGWNLATNGVATEATNVKPGDYVDFSGDKNISVSHDGTKVKVELNKDIAVNYVQTNALNAKYNLSVGTANENGTVPFFVNSNGAFYAANGKLVVDKDGKLVAPEAELGKVTADEGVIGNVVLKDGVFYKHTALRDGELFVGDADGNYSQITTKGAKLGKVTVAADGKISGVAAGAVTADSTDAVNGSQLHAVATEASKHSKVVGGNNINVEETDVDGQKFYKVNMNKDIILGDLTGKYVNISGTNGTIETTGYIATKDRVYADKGGKLADIDVTDNKISNGASSIVLDGSNVKVNDKVTIDQNGKISGVAAGEVSSTSTDAINGSQLYQTNENVAQNKADIAQNKADIAQNKADIAQNKADIAQNKADIAQNKADIAQNKADIATNKADIATNKADIATNKANIAQNAADIKKVEALAKKHTTVTAGDNITVTEDTNKDGGKEYKVALDKKITLDSVTTGQTVMNNDGLKVGKDVSVTATAVTAGKTSISDEGVKVGDKTYISDKGLNANDQKVTNVAAGEISATSKDAVNGSQLYATNQEVVNNTNRINKLGSRVNKVGAGAAALAALHPMDFDPDDKLTFSAGYGNYAGENAAAIGAYYRPDEKVMFSVAGTVGNGENMVNAGVSFALDRTNHVSNSRTALAREVIDLRGQLAVMGAKMAKMEKAFGMLGETKTKLFPDIPANHWAYEYIAKLAGNGYIEGYPDGNFGGDRLMTRYEFAAMLYRAIENGAALEEKIIKEFEPELGRIRVDRISGEDGDRNKIERVRVNDTKGERDHYGNKLAK